jgi:hypothetical protein
MKHYLIYIYIVLLALASCTNAPEPAPKGNGTLSFASLTRNGANAAEGIDQDLAIRVLDGNGDVFVEYRAGEIPRKIVLEEGKFTIQAYTENQDTWHTENNGQGAPCYFGSLEVDVEYDYVTTVSMEVPIVNYAVTLTLPDLFEDLFKSYTFALSSGTRTVNIKEGEKAYFSVADGGFTYKLSATNTDNVSHSTTPITYRNVEAGKLYNMTYYYGTDANSGDLDIEITDDMETEDVPVE